MAKKPYLEFSVEDRHASARLYKKKLKAGIIHPPDLSECSACLQRDGKIEAHREDYSYSDLTSLVALCYRCHRCVHMRDRYPAGWKRYISEVRAGYKYPPTADIGTAARDMREGGDLLGTSNKPRERTVLDDIDEGVLLYGTPEDRQERLAKLRAELGSGALQPSLF